MGKVEILNVMIDSLTMNTAIQSVEKFIVSGQPHLVATANAEMVMMSQQDKELLHILNRADLVVPDGAGVVWAARYYGLHMPERVAGYDLTQHLLAVAARKGYRVFLFGGAPGIVDKAKAEAEKRFPGISVVGIQHGYFRSEDEPEIIERIRNAQPHILLAALGVPKQEKWLSKYLQVLHVPMCMGVGGTFDVMAGHVKRAPVWMQRAGLEWLYRLLLQPQRAIRMIALPRFAMKVIFAKNH